MKSSQHNPVQLANYLKKIREQVGQIVVGQDVVVERTIQSS